jgi:hypothetical protein
MHRKASPGLVGVGPSPAETEAVPLMATKSPVAAPLQVTVKSLLRSMVENELAFVVGSAGTVSCAENEPTTGTAEPPLPESV